MPKRRQQQGGFTLLETLVALAILAIALGSSMTVFNESLGRSRHAAMEGDAAALAKSLLDQLGLTLSIRNPSVHGEASPYRWRIDLSPYDLHAEHDDSSVPVALVTVQIGWTESGRPKFLTLRTLRPGIGRAPPS